jgi:hypothetical protein
MTFYLILVVCLIAFFTYMIYMPGRSYQGELPALDPDGVQMARRLETHVAALCSNPAGRNYIEKEGLAAARAYIAAQFEASGYPVNHQEYQIAGDTFANLEVTRTGSTRAHEIVIVGAHYDAVIGAPGANDNGSGVAALLELAARLKDADFPLMKSVETWSGAARQAMPAITQPSRKASWEIGVRSQISIILEKFVI